MGLQKTMFSREQIFIPSIFTSVLKQWEKATEQHAGTNGSMDTLPLVEFSREWFGFRFREQSERIARLEQWRREWEERRQAIQDLFNRFDADGNGVLTLSELDDAMIEFAHFFGFAVDEGFDDVGAWFADEVNEGRLGGKALFGALDKDASGIVTFEEFWEVVSGWIDNGFDALEQYKAERAERQREAARLEAERRALEERMRREAELEAAEAARKAAEAEEALRKLREAEAARLEEIRLAELKAAEEAERLRMEALLKGAQDKAAAEEAERARLEAERRAAEAEEAEKRRLKRLEEERLAKEAAEAAAAAAAKAAAEAAERAAQQKRWIEAVEAVERKAADLAVTTAQVVAEVQTQLDYAEPGYGATALYMLSADGNGDLAVMGATARARSQGQLVPSDSSERWLVGASSPVAAAAFDCRASGEGKVHLDISMAPLKQNDGHCFGVLASGGPAIPTELLEMMSARAGLAIEEVERRAWMANLVEVAKMWISVLAEETGEVGVEWVQEELDGKGGLSGDETTMTIPLTGKRGHLRVKAKKGTLKGDGKETLIMGLEHLAPIVPQAAQQLDAIPLGTKSLPTLTLPDDLAGLEGISKMILPKKIAASIRAKLSKLDPKKVMDEIKSYKSPPKAVMQVMQGVITVSLKVPLKEMGEWGAVRSHVGNKLVQAMDALDSAAKAKKKPWTESASATKGLTSDEALKKGSAPVQLMLQWLEVARLLRKIAVQIRKMEADDD